MKRRRKKRGIANLWVVIAIPVLVGFVGLAIDTGFMVWVGQQLQIGADASALAGALVLRDDIMLARLDAAAIAVQNEAAGDGIQLALNEDNAADGDIVVGRFDRATRTFTPQEFGVNAIKVVARRTAGSLNGPLSLLFGPALGFNTANIQREAIAMIGGGTGSGMIILAENGGCTLDISGSVVLNVTDEDAGGSIQVDSSSECAFCIQGDAIVEASEINIVYDGENAACQTGNAATLPGDINPDSEYVPDPLADVAEPGFDPSNDLGTINITGGGTHTASPGYYSGGISINNGTLTLDPGIYILGGSGLDITGSANFYAEGVMIFLESGGIEISGTGEVVITAPDPSVNNFVGADTYEGIAVFQSRSNTTEGLIIGTADVTLEGTYYFSNNHMGLAGDGVQIGNQFIVYTAEVFGNGELTINYDGRNPAPGNKVFLVG
jgi:hypothetical protein